MSVQESAYKLMGGTDGLRGTATTQSGDRLINPNTAAGLAHAVAMHQREQGFDGPMVVARDTRLSGEYLMPAVIDGARAAGVEVFDAGILPTPGAQRLARQCGALATFVLTASHNANSENGFKYMPGYHKPSLAEVRAISDRYGRQVERGFSAPVTGTIPLERNSIVSEQYIQDIVADISQVFGDEPLTDRLFVVDGANGAGRHITPEVFRRLGAEVVEFSCDGLGLINDGCGAAELQGLRDFLLNRPDILRDRRFQGGVAVDGDADRFMGVGVADGQLVDITGNHVMEAMARHPRQQGIVGTIYSNSGMVERLRTSGIDFAYCDNGDVHVTNSLLDKQRSGLDWTRGGEFTGHLIDTTWLVSGDGSRSAAWFAAWAAQNNASFGDIHSSMPLWPEKIVKLKPEFAGEKIDEQPLVVQALERAIAQMGDGRFVVRWSGTEQGVARVWGEGPDIHEIDAAVDRVAQAVMALH